MNKNWVTYQNQLYAGLDCDLSLFRSDIHNSVFYLEVIIKSKRDYFNIYYIHLESFIGIKWEHI